MSELAVALLFAALLTPSSAPVATPATVSAQPTAAHSDTENGAKSGQDVRDPQSRDKRVAGGNADAKPSTIAQAPAAAK